MTGLPHLIRPWWLLALAALPLLAWAWQRLARADTPWRRLVDSHLLPSLLQQAPPAKRPVAWLFCAGYVLAVIAMAGPAWRQPVAVYAPRAPLVIVQDMSSHTMVADLAPSRMLRARLKVQQLIALRKGGQLGLVAYAGDAFTVAPLSDDANSLSDLVVALTPETMPVDGQRADRGIQQALALLKQAGFDHGSILLSTDSADAAAIAAARDAHAKGFEVDVLGIGTATGAPLPTADGTFAQDGAGAMRIARLDADSLRSLANAGGGRYAELATTSTDLAQLGVLDPKSLDDRAVRPGEALGWRDGGPFLLLLLLPLAALGFRRGWLTIVLVAVFAMPLVVAPAQAAPAAFEGLWQRKDQRADQALRAGDAAKAGALAQTPGQRAAAAYRGGDFAAAAKAWESLDTADANYNRGNALARMQRFDDAIAAYARALKQDPGMADARANLGVVQELQKRKQPQKKNQGQSSSNPQQGQQRKDEPNQQGESKNQENMQRSPQAGAKPQDPAQDNPQASPAGQAGSPQADAGQQAPDAKKQAEADAAQRKAMQQALLERERKAAKEQRKAFVPGRVAAQSEKREATEALLRRVPDNQPVSLLRRKFAIEYARRQEESGR